MNYKKNPYQAPPPEEYLTHRPYALTISPSDNYQCDYKPDRLYSCTRRFNQKLKELFRETVDYYELRVEISKNGRYHLHGIMVIKSRLKVLKFYERMLPLKEFGTFAIVKQTNCEPADIVGLYTKDWFKYCTKQQHLFPDGKQVILEPHTRVKRKLGEPVEKWTIDEIVPEKEILKDDTGKKLVYYPLDIGVEDVDLVNNTVTSLNTMSEWERIFTLDLEEDQLTSASILKEDPNAEYFAE